MTETAAQAGPAKRLRSADTVAAPATGPTVRIPTGWVDRLLGSDPGLNRFRGALLAVLTIAVTLEAEWLFVHFTGALQIPAHGTALPAAEAAKVALANHEFLVIAMLLGAIVGMISSFAVMDPTAGGQLATMLFLPVPMVSALALGIALGGYRVLALTLLAVVLAVGTYLRRFGPRGLLAGLLMFMGYFFGFFLHEDVGINDLGWLTAEIVVGLVVAIIIRFVFFYPNQAKALARTQRSYGARARKVAALVLELFDDPEHSDRDVRRLHSQLVRLNEAALMIDAQLGDPSAVADGSSGQLLHQRLFDVELALTNIARFAQAMARLDLPADQRTEIRQALLAIVRRDAPAARSHATNLIDLLRSARPAAADDDRGTAHDRGTTDDRTAAGEDRTTVVPHRFAGSVVVLADAMTEWMALGATSGDKGPFQPAVVLFGGWLPGSAEVSATASQERGTRLGDRIRLAPYTRSAIQMGIAVGGAIALGDLVSGERFYWAVIAVFITFMGANNSGEQSRKAFYRVAGTVVGIGLGSLLVEAVGHHAYGAISVVLVSLFFGFYLMRINYAFMVVGITVMVSQLYVELDEFSNSLLLLRLGETALGAVVAIAVVTLVLPLRTRRVLRVALRDHVEAIGRLVEHASDHLVDQSHQVGGTLRADARAVDASYQALVATVQPLRRSFSGSPDGDAGRAVRLASASRHYSRNLVADVESVGLLDAETRQDIERASGALHQSLEVVIAALNGLRDGTYVRSSALFDRAERRLEERSAPAEEGQFAIRDLKLIDGALARMAEVMGLAITDYDTVPAARSVT